MKALLEWTPEGVPLEDFIDENDKLLEKTRIFYIVQANRLFTINIYDLATWETCL